MANVYAQHYIHPALTPQSAPIPGREAEMVANNAGGVTFKLDDWDRLHRFLILGSEGGTYYVDQRNLTQQNADAVVRCIKTDGVRAVEAAHAVNVANRAPKVDSQLFVLALALKHGDQATKNRVAALAPDMLRVGTHVLHFAAMLDSLGGWNRSKRRVIANWLTQDADRLAYQAVKYRQRDGWAMRDLLRVAHPAPPTEAHAGVYDWLCGRATERPLPAIVQALNAMQASDADPVTRALFGISQNLPREALPTEALNDKRVLAQLLPHMPPHALIRNLGSMTAEGLDYGMLATVEAKLREADALRKARVHPFALLLAALVYRGGAGARGGKTWTPSPAILGALEDAYDAAFAWTEPTNKRILVGIDISGSMGAPCVGTPIPAATAATAMAITLARLEPHATVVQFDTAVQRILPITRRTGIASIESVSGGGTDLAAPARWACGEATVTHHSRLWGGGFGQVAGGTQLAAKVMDVDAFVILTDNETWAGHGHTAEWLAQYRRRVNAKAKLICFAMAANNANVVDPADPLQLGAAGLDANLPTIAAEFISA